MMNEPIPPAIPPIPVMVAMAFFGNISPTVEKIFADQAWCAAPATPIINTGIQYVAEPKGCAKSANKGKNAKINIAFILPLYAFIPFFSTKYFGSHPPIIDSKVIIYNTNNGNALCVESIPYTELKYAGVQNKKNHQTPSVMNFPNAKAQVCL